MLLQTLTLDVKKEKTQSLQCFAAGCSAGVVKFGCVPSTRYRSTKRLERLHAALANAFVSDGDTS